MMELWKLWKYTQPGVVAVAIVVVALVEVAVVVVEL